MDEKPHQFRFFLSLNMYKMLEEIYSLLAPRGSKLHSLTQSLIKRLLNIRYQKFIQRFDNPRGTDLQFFRDHINSFETKPVISIIMPVYNPNLKYLEQAIQSVRDQVYPNWELCIADDASTVGGVHELILKHTMDDSRIKAVYREVNGHISAASNSALEIASGDFIALLDQDDKLHPLALYYMGKEVNKHPNSEVIYSDEDKLTTRGKRISPYFKSDFDEELLLCHNMVSHLGVYKRKTVQDIGGFRVGLEGSQDYDLLLRVLERINPSEIHHIPRILYHWRISKQSVAESVEAKPYALESGAQAITSHLENRGIDAVVEPYQKYGYKIRYNVPMSQPSVEVFFLNKSEHLALIDHIYSLLDSTKYSNLRVNCQPTNETIWNQLKELNDNRIFISDIVEDQTNYNHTIDLKNSSFADVIVIINQHSYGFSHKWLENLLGILFKPGVGAVSPQLVGKNGKIFSSGIVLGLEVFARHTYKGVLKSAPDLYFGWANLDKGYSALPSGCLLVKREDFIEAGGLNQSLSNETAQIIDLCLKFKEKGLRNVIVPDVLVAVDPVIKSHSADEELIQNPSDQEYFRTCWMKWLDHDPAFNPNLTLHKGRPVVSNNPKIDYPYASQ